MNEFKDNAVVKEEPKEHECWIPNDNFEQLVEENDGIEDSKSHIEIGDVVLFDPNEDKEHSIEDIKPSSDTLEQLSKQFTLSGYNTSEIPIESIVKTEDNNTYKGDYLDVTIDNSQLIDKGGSEWSTDDDLTLDKLKTSLKAEESDDSIEVISDKATKRKRSIKNGENFKCQYCSYVSTIKNRIERHTEAVHLKIKHKCELCDYESTRKERLKSHIDKVHLKLKIESKCHKCEFCNFTTSRKGSLKTHTAAVHLKLRDFKCELCDYTAARKDRINIHVQSVHLGVRKYKCGICDFSASVKPNLKSHIEVVHLNLKRFKCEYCDYSTAQLGPLNTHTEAVHLKTKKYQCEFCNCTSFHEVYIRKHIRKFHRELLNKK